MPGYRRYGKYCIAHVSMTYSAGHIIELKIAMCVPPSCSKFEHFQEVLDEQNKILVSLQYPLIVEKKRSDAQQHTFHIYSFGAKTALIVCPVIFVLVIFGSAIDLISKYTSLLAQELDNKPILSYIITHRLDNVDDIILYSQEHPCSNEYSTASFNY